MAKCIDVWPEEISETADLIECRARVEGPEGMRTLWFRLPARHRDMVTEQSDPFAIAALFAAMREGVDLRVHGQVSPTLLENLEEFQTIWSCWRPDRYRQVSIDADSEAESPPVLSGETAVSFSGGLDSCFSVWRHRNGRAGRRGRNLTAGVMVHGFDIPLDQTEAYERAAENSRMLLESVGMKLIPMSSNFREYRDAWEDTHGAALAACLHLISGGHSSGLIPGTYHYDRPRMPWGSTPLTDALFSSENFPIVGDAHEFKRNEKAAMIADWQEGMDRVRVCWAAAGEGGNCGACLKCVYTALCFAVEGLDPPDNLRVPSLERGVLEANLPDQFAADLWQEILTEAYHSNITEPWVASLEKLLRKYQKRGRWRRLVRGITRRF